MLMKYNCRWGGMDRSASTCGSARADRCGQRGAGVREAGSRRACVCTCTCAQQFYPSHPGTVRGLEPSRWCERARAQPARTWHPTPMNSRRFTSSASTVASTCKRRRETSNCSRTSYHADQVLLQAGMKARHLQATAGELAVVTAQPPAHAAHAEVGGQRGLHTACRQDVLFGARHHLPSRSANRMKRGIAGSSIHLVGLRKAARMSSLVHATICRCNGRAPALPMLRHRATAGPAMRV